MDEKVEELKLPRYVLYDSLASRILVASDEIHTLRTEIIQNMVTEYSEVLVEACHKWNEKEVALKNQIDELKAKLKEKQQ